MERHEIPTARFAVVHSLSQARANRSISFRAASWSKPTGSLPVKVWSSATIRGRCADRSERVVNEKNLIPGGGTDVVLEERMTGREVSVFAISDGRAMIPIAAACDYKRAGDDDRGPNTGGMGAYSPPARLPRQHPRGSCASGDSSVPSCAAVPKTKSTVEYSTSA